MGGLQPTIRTGTAFSRSASAYAVASLCYSHCSTCVAQDVKGHDDLTSSPPSSELSSAVSPESPTLLAGNRQQGLRSLRDLTQHLTTRADDNHAPPVSTRPKSPHVSMSLVGCQVLVRFFALRRIKPHAPLLVRAPVNSFEFQPCGRTPQAEYLLRLLRHRGSLYPLHLVFIVYGVDYQGI